MSEHIANSHATESTGFVFSDIALPLRVASMIVLAVLSFIALGGTARYAATLPKEDTTQQNQPSNQSQTGPNQNQQTTPSITQPTVNPGSSSSTTTRCTAAQRNTFTNQYNSQVASENARHQSVLNFLNATGASPSAFAAENNTHNTNLNSINTQYQNNLRSIGC